MEIRIDLFGGDESDGKCEAQEEVNCWSESGNDWAFPQVRIDNPDHHRSAMSSIKREKYSSSTSSAPHSACDRHRRCAESDQDGGGGEDQMSRKRARTEVVSAELSVRHGEPTPAKQSFRFDKHLSLQLEKQYTFPMPRALPGKKLGTAMSNKVLQGPVGSAGNQSGDGMEAVYKEQDLRVRNNSNVSLLERRTSVPSILEIGQSDYDPQTAQYEFAEDNQIFPFQYARRNSEDLSSISYRRNSSSPIDPYLGRFGLMRHALHRYRQQNQHQHQNQQIQPAVLPPSSFLSQERNMSSPQPSPGTADIFSFMEPHFSQSSPTAAKNILWPLSKQPQQPDIVKQVAINNANDDNFPILSQLDILEQISQFQHVPNSSTDTNQQLYPSGSGKKNALQNPFLSTFESLPGERTGSRISGGSSVCNTISREPIDYQAHESVQKLAVYFRFATSKIWRYRDLKRSLLDKMIPSHKEFIDMNKEHALLKDRLPHKMSYIAFAKRIMLLLFHFIIRDGQLPNFWTRLDTEKQKELVNVLQLNELDFLGRVNQKRAFEIHKQFVILVDPRKGIGVDAVTAEMVECLVDGSDALSLLSQHRANVTHSLQLWQYQRQWQQQQQQQQRRQQLQYQENHLSALCHPLSQSNVTGESIIQQQEFYPPAQQGQQPSVVPQNQAHQANIQVIFDASGLEDLKRQLIQALQQQLHK